MTAFTAMTARVPSSTASTRAPLPETLTVNPDRRDEE